jgi:hypothetical protein
MGGGVPSFTDGETDFDSVDMIVSKFTFHAFSRILMLS